MTDELHARAVDAADDYLSGTLEGFPFDPWDGGPNGRDVPQSEVTRGVINAYLASLAEQGDPLVRRSAAESALPRTDDRAHDLRLRLHRAVRWLRDAEDIARIEMPAWPTADRIRDIYEQVGEDILNGKTTKPPLLQRLRDAEQVAEGCDRLRSLIVAAVNHAQTTMVHGACNVPGYVPSVDVKFTGDAWSDLVREADAIQRRFAPGPEDGETVAARRREAS